MLNVDEKAMAYCLIEALFAAGLLNLPTYQNFLRMKREQEEEEATSVYASVKPEIKINEEYFEKNGIPLETEEPEEEPEKNTGETGAEIKVNLDAEYFKWKEDADGGKEEKKPERHSFFGKRPK